jgi:hypothetical protein
MIQWIKDNQAAATWGMFAMITATAILVLNGCSLDQMVKFDPPPAVSEAIQDDREAIPLADGELVWERWREWVALNTDRLEDAIGDAHGRWEVLNAIGDTGLGFLGEAAPAIPGGGLLFGGLTLLSGLMLKRPGTDKFVSKEKQDSYNAGIEAGKKVAIQLYEAAKDANAPEEDA